MTLLSKSVISLCSLSLVMVMSGCGTSETVTKETLAGIENQPHKIERANWEGVDPLVNSVLGDLQVTSDEDKVSFKISNGSGFGAHMQFFIDVDNNQNTGYRNNIWTDAGSNYLVEDGYLYQSTSDSTSWGWSYVAKVDYVKTSSYVEVEIDKSLLVNLNSSLKVGAISRTSSWGIDKLLPSSAAMAQYTIGEVLNPPADTIAPVISIIGAQDMEHTLGDVYNDLGAVANDNSDGDVTNLITVSNSVNVNVAGEYTVVYSVSDVAGNTASQTRTVTVVAEAIEEPENPNPVESDIVVDGQNGDWASIIALHTSGQDNLKAADDSEKLYFMIDGNIGANSQFFIDSDNNVATGFNSRTFSNGGADYLIENGSLYRSTSNGSAWGWQYVTGATFAKSESVVEVSVDKSLLTNLTEDIKIAAIARSSSWGVLSQLPANAMSTFKTGVVVEPPVENTKPTASSISRETDEDVSLAITLSGNDADGDTLTYRITEAPTNGTLEGEAPNVSYVPNEGFSGTDSFSFVANDGTEDSETAIVTITVEDGVVFEGPFADIQTLIQDVKDGVLATANYISVGDSTRADDNYYNGGAVFAAVSSQLQADGLSSMLQATAGHAFRKWNNYDEVELIEPTWEETVAVIPGDGSSTIVNMSLGINDARYYGDGGEKERIKFHMGEALDKIIALKPNTNFVLTMPHKLIGFDTKIIEIKEAYEEMSVERGIPLINTMDELFSGADDLSLYRVEDAAEYGEDIRIHLSAAGQALVSDLILSKILP